ncbi:hypothetical protein DVH24_015952 [Malus domestica]|uniref:Inhibitor I9 domain-containing protein n=1 Tax=Malus domestica TaxID=3750 RepID=A0A498JG91_MALDO|nr:hypothetical protein DVH24_015952 [Malus domestica]
MKKGILTTHSAGNSGPAEVSVSSVAPWILTVAASTADRRIINNFSFRIWKRCFRRMFWCVLCTGCLKSSLVKEKIVVCDSYNGDSEARRAGAQGAILTNWNNEASISSMVTIFIIETKTMAKNGALLVAYAFSIILILGMSLPEASSHCSEYPAQDCAEGCLDPDRVKGKYVMCDNFGGLIEADRAGARGAVLKNHGSLLYPFSIILMLAVSLPSEAADQEDRKTYIVYLGSLPKDQLFSPLSHHIGILESITESSSPSNLLVRSYKKSFNGFAAKLTDRERERLANMEGVVSVFLSTTYQLQTTRSWDFLGFSEKVKRNPTVESNAYFRKRGEEGRRQREENREFENYVV